MRMMFAGGGTAGHVNPAIAVADYICRQEPSEVRLSGGRGHIEEKLAQQAGYPIDLFEIEGLSREKSLEGVKKNMRAVRESMDAVREASRIIKEWKPDVVMGTGGYASFPMVSAALRCHVPTAILEVNATPGVATKLLAGRVDCTMISYAETEQMIPHHKQLVLTGSPVREEIIRCREKSWTPIFGNGLPTLCCFWGSVGAQYMNEKMEDVLLTAAQRQEFNVLYAAGGKHYERMRARLAEKGLDPARCPNIDFREYIFDMDHAMGACDLFLTRAGGTLSELCAAGRPSVLVPSPFVAENHQEKNARVLERAGAAVVMTENEASPEKIYDTVRTLLADPARLEQMGARAKEKAQPQALEQIYRVLRSLAGHD